MPILLFRQISTMSETFNFVHTSYKWKHFFTKNDCDNSHRAI